MGNEQASRVVQAPGIETNQGDRPPMVRYNIGDEDVELFSESERDVFTEAPRSANYRFPPPKQAEVFRTPEECHSYNGDFNKFTFPRLSYMAFCQSFCSFCLSCS